MAGTELTPGTMITPTLRLERQLGAGGMGRVWIAEHLGLRTQVVVKFMSEELAHSEEALARFSREAAAASQVKSPHVVHISDFGMSSIGLPYIAMELLEGKDLSQLIAKYGTLDPCGVSKIVTQVARALMRAHEKGIIHRDIKPENIFLIDAGGGEIFVKVLDFGVAKAGMLDTVRTTGTGVMLGTPMYMSPEQVLGAKNIDHRSDLWSLGVVAYEALTGSVPFNGDTVGAISVAICSGPIPRPSGTNPSIGPAVDAWFAQCCERDPSARFASAKALADALANAVASDAHASGYEETQIATLPKAESHAEAPDERSLPSLFDEKTTVQRKAVRPDPTPHRLTDERASSDPLGAGVPLAEALTPAPELADGASRPLRPTTNGATERAATPTGSSIGPKRFVLAGAAFAALIVGALSIALIVGRSSPTPEDVRPRRVRAKEAPAAEPAAANGTEPEPPASAEPAPLPSVSASVASSAPSSKPSAPPVVETPKVQPAPSASAPKPKKKGTYVIE